MAEDSKQLVNALRRGKEARSRFDADRYISESDADCMALSDEIMRLRAENKLHRDFLVSIIEYHDYGDDNVAFENVCKAIERRAQQLDRQLAVSVHEIESNAVETNYMRVAGPEASGEATGPEGDDSNMGTAPTSGPEATSSQGNAVETTEVPHIMAALDRAEADPVLDHRFIPDSMDPGFCAKCSSTKASHRDAGETAAPATGGYVESGSYLIGEQASERPAPRSVLKVAAEPYASLNQNLDKVDRNRPPLPKLCDCPGGTAEHIRGCPYCA